MFKRDRRRHRRRFQFEKLEIRALLASDLVWNNSHWDPLFQENQLGVDGLATSSRAFYAVESNIAALNLVRNKLVVGLDTSDVQLPTSLRPDFGLEFRARVYESSEPITPEFVAAIEQIPGVGFTAPLYVEGDVGGEIALLDEFVVNLK
ncbi:MAG: hypothetical protein ACKOCH_06325, partial [Bacteroidota bacterium]